MIETLKELIQPIAPTLASALSGPYADMATKFIADGVGDGDGGPSGDASDLVTRLNRPADLQKVKDAEEQFKTEMRQLDVDVFALERSRNGNAREPVSSGTRSQMVITVIFLAGYFGMLAAIFWVEVSDKLNMSAGDNSMMGELQILFGVLTAGVGQILSFWFGGMLQRQSKSAA